MARRGRPRKTPTKQDIMDVKVPEKEINEVKIDTNVFSVRGKLLHVKVGQPGDLPTDDHLLDIENKIKGLISEHDLGCAVLVTHCLVDIKII